MVFSTFVVGGLYDSLSLSLSKKKEKTTEGMEFFLLMYKL